MTQPCIAPFCASSRAGETPTHVTSCSVTPAQPRPPPSRLSPAGASLSAEKPPVLSVVRTGGTYAFVWGKKDGIVALGDERARPVLSLRPATAKLEGLIRRRRAMRERMPSVSHPALANVKRRYRRSSTFAAPPACSTPARHSRNQRLLPRSTRVLQRTPSSRAMPCSPPTGKVPTRGSSAGEMAEQRADLGCSTAAVRQGKCADTACRTRPPFCRRGQAAAWQAAGREAHRSSSPAVSRPDVDGNHPAIWLFLSRLFQLRVTRSRSNVGAK